MAGIEAPFAGLPQLFERGAKRRLAGDVQLHAITNTGTVLSSATCPRRSRACSPSVSTALSRELAAAIGGLMAADIVGQACRRLAWEATVPKPDGVSARPGACPKRDPFIDSRLAGAYVGGKRVGAGTNKGMTVDTRSAATLLGWKPAGPERRKPKVKAAEESSRMVPPWGRQVLQTRELAVISSPFRVVPASGESVLPARTPPSRS